MLTDNNMKNYKLYTAVTAQQLYPVFEAAVRTSCAADYTLEQIDAWVRKGDLRRWNRLLMSDLWFMAALHIPTNEVAGFTSVDPTGYMHSMFVHPAHQHRGVGTFLMSEAEKFAMRFKVAALDAEVSMTARPFFERMGFRVQCAHLSEAFGVEMDNYVMSKPLIYPAKKSDYAELLQLWEASVRATHHFLREEDIQFYKSLILEQYFPAVSLYVVYHITGKIVAFMGLSKGVIEMLFVHPSEFKKGYGSLLIDFAVKKKRIYKVDVNEQNEAALEFYLHRGFQIVGRDDLDRSGEPFPVLHLRMKK